MKKCSFNRIVFTLQYKWPNYNNKTFSGTDVTSVGSVAKSTKNNSAFRAKASRREYYELPLIKGLETSNFAYIIISVKNILLHFNNFKLTKGYYIHYTIFYIVIFYCTFLPATIAILKCLWNDICPHNFWLHWKDQKIKLAQTAWETTRWV